MEEMDYGHRLETRETKTRVVGMQAVQRKILDILGDQKRILQYLEGEKRIMNFVHEQQKVSQNSIRDTGDTAADTCEAKDALALN
ncbi:hypothetical protein MMC10_003805 [Thelotrema lepadinum]|nr:hypothetical protein [Thelotrema lepadinum]